METYVNPCAFRIICEFGFGYTLTHFSTFAWKVSVQHSAQGLTVNDVRVI